LYLLLARAEKSSFRQQEHPPCRKPVTTWFTPVQST